MRKSRLDCDVDNEERTCPTCGWQARARHVRRNCPPKLSAALKDNLPPYWAWGSWLSIWLKAWGISPETITAMNERLSVKVSDCGCKTRELLLNYAGLRCARAVGWMFRLALRRPPS